MAQIDKPNQYFNTLTYTGDGVSPKTITGVGFQPDWLWVKRRNDAAGHNLYDAVRTAGSDKNLQSNGNGAEGSGSPNLYGYVNAFASDGYTTTAGTTDNTSFNKNNDTYVAWNWLANGSGSANTDGSINSTVSANTTSGFSIVTWTGNATESTIGHGLSSAPTIFIVKNRTDAGNDWRVGQVLTSSNNMTDGNGYYLDWNDTKASTNPGSAVLFGATPTAPTSSVFTVGTNNGINGSGDDMLAYCFHSVKGYSKMGSYIGNGSTDGTFVYTGFKPAMIIIKAQSAVADWYILDNKRDPENVVEGALRPNLSNAESTTINDTDFLSNGFKIRSTSGSTNGSGTTYIYMAFAENPIVGSNNIPATAR